MPDFKYRARDKFVKLVTGVITANDKDIAAKKLKDMGYIPISISKTSGVTAERVLEKLKGVKLQELSAFTRQLYALQKAGVSLLSGLEAIALQTKNQYFKIVIEEISRDISAGSSLSEGLQKHSNIFDSIYVAMIKSAEASGKMAEILKRLAELIEQDVNTRARIKAATRYPMIALLVLSLGFLIVVTFVIPRFSSLYSQFGADLPLPTQILIGINIIIKHFWYLVVLGLGILGFCFIRFINSKLGRPLWDNFKLKLPVFGQLTSFLVMSRFARVTSVLMASGVPILKILELVSQATGNVIVSRAIGNIRESVHQGKGISEPMKVSGLFPPVVVQMVSVGEETGKIDELLLNVADYYDQESEYMIKNLTTYIEPILIFILGVMVLIMALGIFMPLWNLIRVFKGG